MSEYEVSDAIVSKLTLKINELEGNRYNTSNINEFFAAKRKTEAIRFLIQEGKINEDWRGWDLDLVSGDMTYELRRLLEEGVLNG